MQVHIFSPVSLVILTILYLIFDFKKHADAAKTKLTVHDYLKHMAIVLTIFTIAEIIRYFLLNLIGWDLKRIVFDMSADYYISGLSAEEVTPLQLIFAGVSGTALVYIVTVVYIVLIRRLNESDQMNPYMIIEILSIADLRLVPLIHVFDGYYWLLGVYKVLGVPSEPDLISQVLVTALVMLIVFTFVTRYIRRFLAAMVLPKVG